MTTRKAPNLYTLAYNHFCGIRRTMSPLALEELKGMGFSPAVRPDNYVEDCSEGWMQDVSLFLKLNHMIVSTALPVRAKMCWLKRFVTLSISPLLASRSNRVLTLLTGSSGQLLWAIKKVGLRL